MDPKWFFVRLNFFTGRIKYNFVLINFCTRSFCKKCLFVMSIKKKSMVAELLQKYFFYGIIYFYTIWFFLYDVIYFYIIWFLFYMISFMFIWYHLCLYDIIYIHMISQSVHPQDLGGLEIFENHRLGGVTISSIFRGGD